MLAFMCSFVFFVRVGAIRGHSTTIWTKFCRILTPTPLEWTKMDISHTKGQLISKANCQVLNSSKKPMNELVFTTV